MSAGGLADPFAVTANPDAYVRRDAAEQVLAALEAGFERGLRAMALSGPPGIGKTMLLRVLERRLASRARCVYLPYAALEIQDLCRWVLGILGEGGDALEPERALLLRARREAAAGRPFLVMLDDASALPLDTARAWQRLAKEAEGALRLLVVPVDDDRAGRVLAAVRPELELRYSTPLDEAESAALVRERLDRSAAPDAVRARFDEAALGRLHRMARGVPRRVLTLATRELRRGLDPQSPNAAEWGLVVEGSGAWADLELDPLADLLPEEEAELAAVREEEAREWAPDADAQEVAAAPPSTVAGPAAGSPSATEEASGGGEETSQDLAEAPESTEEPRPREETPETVTEAAQEPAGVVAEPAPSLDDDVEAAVARAFAGETTRDAALERVAAGAGPSVAKPEVQGTGDGMPQAGAAAPRLPPRGGREAASWLPPPVGQAPEEPTAEEGDVIAAPESPPWRRPAPPAPAGRSGGVVRRLLGGIAVAVAAVLLVWLGLPDAEPVPPPAAPPAVSPQSPPQETAPAPAPRPALEPDVRPAPPPEAPAPEAEIGPAPPAPDAAAGPADEGASEAEGSEVARVPSDVPPTAPEAAAPEEPVAVHINAFPWARVLVDGRDLGYTPLADVPLPPGLHRFRVEFPDGRVLERQIAVGPENRHLSFAPETSPEVP